MSAGTWVLTGFLVAGVLLPLIGALAVLRLVLRVRSRIAQMRHARLFTSLESLQLQNARLQLLLRRAAALASRAQAATETLRASTAASGYPQIRQALQSAGAEISALFTALR
jgi:hypothetical protein